MATTMCLSQEPILSKLDRLDNMLRQLEEVRGCNRYSSCSSTRSSGTLTSVELSPKSIEKQCRPIEHVVMETEMKGTLIERLHHVEDRVLKLCLQLEELVAQGRKDELNADNLQKKKKNNKKKGLINKLVKQCVRN